MIARFQHITRGNERVVGGATSIQTPAIGVRVLDVIIGGVSYNLTEEMNSVTGVLTFPFTLPRRTVIQMLYKKLPRRNVFRDFAAADFNSDFFI